MNDKYMEFIIDNRESIKSHFTEKNLDYVICKNMEIGDFAFYVNKELICIFERKTIEDLAGSIKDGRYREQKKRLLDNIPKSKILYIIEGDLTKNNRSFSFNKVSKDTIYSSLINCYLRDNINIIHTLNTHETIEILEQFCKKILKQGTDFLSSSSSTYDEDLIKSIVQTKKKNITPELVFTSQLTCISGVSTNTANLIVKKYQNMNMMISELNKLSEDDRKKELSSIQYTTDKGKVRKLGPAIAEKILFNMGLNP